MIIVVVAAIVAASSCDNTASVFVQVWWIVRSIAILLFLLLLWLPDFVSTGACTDCCYLFKLGWVISFLKTYCGTKMSSVSTHFPDKSCQKTWVQPTQPNHHFKTMELLISQCKKIQARFRTKKSYRDPSFVRKYCTASGVVFWSQTGFLTDTIFTARPDP